MFDGLVSSYMTAQEVWSKVANHLMQQGRVCYSPNNGCAYYDPITGMKCAVGVLIPENEYTPNCEGNPLHVLKGKHYCPPTLKSLTDRCGPLLTDLQRIHDVVENHIPTQSIQRKVWFVALRNLASKYGLDTAEFTTRWQHELDITY